MCSLFEKLFKLYIKMTSGVDSNWGSISSLRPMLPKLVRNAIGGDCQVKHILDGWHISMRI